MNTYRKDALTGLGNRRALMRDLAAELAAVGDAGDLVLSPHTEIGERIVSAAPSLASAAPLVRSSHERHDGTGYPDGLAGDEIAVGASIISVCDAFDAMTSTCSCSAAVSVAEAVAELRHCAGTQFHPDVVHAFSRLVEDGSEVLRRAA